MQLPNRERVLIEERKLTDYLLNERHPDNGGKAAFFKGWGFTAEAPSLLADAIRAMVHVHAPIFAVTSRWGAKYIVDGCLHGPKGETPKVRTVWIVEKAGLQPRLVTAYPAPERVEA